MLLARAKLSGNRGFTLVELLVSAVLTVLLAAIIAPALSRRIERAQSAACISNIARLGAAVAMYAQENNDRLPGCQHSMPSWTTTLNSFCATNVMLCPADPARSAGFSSAVNDFFTPHPFGSRHLNYSRLSGIPAPHETILFAERSPDYARFDHFHFADEKDNGYSAPSFREQVDVERHGSGANYLFPDGHVETLDWSTVVRPRLAGRSRFVHPEGKPSAAIAGSAQETASSTRSFLSGR